MANQTEDSFRTITPAILCMAVAILAVLFLMAGIASAGTISIDTSALASAPVGTTVQVPVIITGADELSGYQLKINTGDTEKASVKFNAASTEKLDHSDKTGIILWAGFMSGETLSGDKTLFTLDVTPKTAGTIDLTLDVTYAYEHVNPSEQVTSYTGTGASLTASGSGTTNTPAATATQTTAPQSGGAAATQTSGPKSTASPSGTAVPATNAPGTTPATPGVTASPETTLPTTTATPAPTKTPVSVFGILAGLTAAAIIKQKRNA